MNNKELKRAAADYAIQGLSNGDTQALANEKEKAFRAGAEFGWQKYTDTINQLRNIPVPESWHMSPDRIFLHVLLTTSLVQLGMDKLEKTGFYKQRLKAAAKTFASEVKRVMEEDMPLVMGVHDEAMYLTMGYQESVVARLATLDVDSYGAVLEFLDQYRTDPEGVLQKLDIKHTDNAVLAKRDYDNRVSQ